MPRKTAARGRAQRTPRGFNEAAARCRGKRGIDAPGFVPVSSFNEAAARCRGKPAGRCASAARYRRASMRPRPDAAENEHPRETLVVRITLQ